MSDWKQYGWRWLIDGGRYEVEHLNYQGKFEAYFLPKVGDASFIQPIMDDEGEDFDTAEKALAACEAHNAERVAKLVVVPS